MKISKKAALREFAGTLDAEPVGTVTHAGHVDWYDQPPPAVWTKLYLHPPAPTTQEPVAWGRTVRSIINLTDPAVYGSERVVIAGKDYEGAFPLFTHPPSPMTLTQDQIMEYVREAGLDWHRGWIMGEPPVNRYEEFARAVLAAQQEKK